MATGLDETGTRPVRDVPTLVDGDPPRVDRRRQWSGTALVAAAGGLLGGLLFLVAYKGMPDDSYITLDYARNVVEHGHWGLTPFRDANSATSPLNVWLLAGGILVTGRPVVAAGLVLVLTTAAMAVWAGQLAGDLGLRRAVVGGPDRRAASSRRRSSPRSSGWSRSWSRRCSWRWCATRPRAGWSRTGIVTGPRGAHAPGPRAAGRRPRRGALRGRRAPPAAQGGARGRRRSAGDAAVAHLVVVRARQLRAGQPHHQDQRCLPRR